MSDLNDKRAGFEAAAKAITERAAGHYRMKNYALQDELLQCASMLHDMKPLRATPAPQAAPSEQRAVYWLEAEESARQQEPHYIVRSMAYSTKLHTSKPKSDNPVWPLFAAAPAVALTPAPQGTASELRCWSCCKPYTLNQRGDADGDCPHCGVEIELDAASLTQAATSEPVAVYQARTEQSWAWTDVSRDVYHFVEPKFRRTLYAAPVAHLSGTTPNTEAPSDEQKRREAENGRFHQWWESSGHAADPTYTLTMENCAHATWQARAALSAQQAGVQEAPSEDAKDIPPLHKGTVRAIVHAWGHAGETHFGLYLRFREAERAALAAATQTEKAPMGRKGAES